MKLYRIYLFIIWAATLIALPACQPEEDVKPSLGDRPTPEDVTFIFQPDSQNDNIIKFTSTSPGFIFKWDLGNGSEAEGAEATGVYPLKGDYTVSLTIYTKGGSATNTQTVTIARTDPTLLDIPAYNLLTGGVDQLEGKTWVIDANTIGHMGVGPAAGPPAESLFPIWWQAPAQDKAGQGIYDDEMTFKLLDFVYEFNNNGDVFANGASAGDLGGTGTGDQKVSYTPPQGMTWSISEEGDRMFLNISKGGFFGFYTGVSKYEILKLEENELFVRFLDSKNPDLAWYHRLIPKGYAPPPPPPPSSISELTIDFEGDDPGFIGFGGNSYAVIDNPDASGINTSGKVAETVHGNETWGGLVKVLDGPLDFSKNNTFKIKVWSPKETTVLMKLEHATDAGIFLEKSQNITLTNTWQELEFDFSDAASDTYSKLVVFFDFGSTEPTTFYFDDIIFARPTPRLSLETLTGSSSKVWKLKPQAAALAVGPAPGSGEWFSNTAAEVEGGRACWFDDEYIFSTDGTYTYDSKGNLYAETYMGVAANGCIAEGDLPTDAQAWGSGSHTFTYTPASGADPALIAVKGTGAFIGLPKAYNGGEYAAAPPTADAEVRYQVLSYEKVDDTETLVLTIDVSAGEAGGAWWTITLVSE